MHALTLVRVVSSSFSVMDQNQWRSIQDMNKGKTEEILSRNTGAHPETFSLTSHLVTYLVFSLSQIYNSSFVFCRVREVVDVIVKHVGNSRYPSQLINVHIKPLA